MGEVQRVKINEHCVINLSRITEVTRNEDGALKVSYSGDDPLTVVPGKAADAFWAFYTSEIHGCLNLCLAK